MSQLPPEAGPVSAPPPPPRRSKSNKKGGSRLDDLDAQAANASRAVQSLTRLVVQMVDGVASFGIFLPVAEILLTMWIYLSTFQDYGAHVLGILVLPQVAALFVSSFYRNIPLTPIGSIGKWVTIGAGIVNTGFASLMFLLHTQGIEVGFYIAIPALVAVIALTGFYITGAQTLSQVHKRRKMEQKAQHALAVADLDHESKMDTHRGHQKIQEVQRKLVINAAKSVAEDPDMTTLFELGIHGDLVKFLISDVMKVDRRDRYGRQVGNLADDMLQDAITEAEQRKATIALPATPPPPAPVAEEAAPPLAVEEAVNEADIIPEEPPAENQ